MYLTFFLIFLGSAGFAFVAFKAINRISRDIWASVSKPHRHSVVPNGNWTEDGEVVRSFFGSEVERFDVVANVFFRTGNEFADRSNETFWTFDEGLIYGEWEPLFSQVVFKDVELDSKALHQTVDVQIPHHVL